MAGVEVGVRKLPGAEALSRSLTGERTQRGHGDARPGEWPRARMHAERTAPLSADSTEAVAEDGKIFRYGEIDNIDSKV